MWDEITYPFLNYNGATVEVKEWISNFIPHFTWVCDYLSMLGLKLIHVIKRGPRSLVQAWSIASATSNTPEPRAVSPNVSCLITPNKNIKTPRESPLMRIIYRWPVNSPHELSRMWKAFPCHDVSIFQDSYLCPWPLSHQRYFDRIRNSTKFVVL